MKKLSLLLVALTFLLASCKPEAEKPTVVTKSVGEVTETTAKVVGQVTADGGAEVTERGVCWNTDGSPEVIDYRTVDGKGIGTYESDMTNLKDNTTYYVRAYAINEKGVSYGEELTFTTKKEVELPTVTTAEVEDITESEAVSGGEVTSDGGGEVTARGICWSTKHNPTLEDEYTIDGKGVGSFTSDMEDLEADTKYYVRAYATNEKGTAYGEEVSFTTEEEEEPEEPGDEPEEPGDEPEQPGDEPEQPGDEPEEPGDEPEEPGDEPEEPGDEPEEPGDEPEQPGDEPEQPGDEPEQPGDEPEQPGDEPEQPGDEPEEPGDEPEEPGDFTTAKCVLLEDYIGVRCNNCPAAGEIALDIQKQYGHNVVVLGIHSGFLSAPIGGYPNFKTTEGDAWYSFFGFDCNPVGTVNRKRNGGDYGFSSVEWAETVATTLQEEATIAMASNVEYDEATRNLKVDVISKALVELPDTYSLTVCIMEDSIVGRQLLPTGVDDNYVHRHVFRKTINGTWGEELNTIALAPKDVINRSYSVVLDEAYNADQCYIIAYIANIDTKEILQVIEKKIK